MPQEYGLVKTFKREFIPQEILSNYPELEGKNPSWFQMTENTSVCELTNWMVNSGGAVIGEKVIIV